MTETCQGSSGVTSHLADTAGNREPDSKQLSPRAPTGPEEKVLSGASPDDTVPMQQSARGPAWPSLPVCRIESITLMAVDVLATYLALYCAAWGTTKWATATGATGGLLAVGGLAVVNVGVFAAFKMYNSLWRYASMTEALRILYATIVGSVCGDLLFSLVFEGGLSVRSYVMAWALLAIMAAGARLAVADHQANASVR